MKSIHTSSRDKTAACPTELQRLWPLAKGSLTEVRKPCIRPGCKACASGQKHAAWIYVYRAQGRAQCRYVPRAFVGPLRQAIGHWRELERLAARWGEQLILGYRQQRIARQQAVQQRNRRP